MSAKIEIQSADEVRQLERAFYTVCQNFFKEGHGKDFSTQQTTILKDKFTNMLRQVFGNARDAVEVKTTVPVEPVNETLKASVEALRNETRDALQKLKENRDSLARTLEKQEQSEKAVDGEKEKEGEDKEAKGACLGCSQEDIDTVAGIQSAIDEQIEHLSEALPKHLQSCRNLFAYLKGKQNMPPSAVDQIAAEVSKIMESAEEEKSSDKYGKAEKKSVAGKHRAKPY